MEKKELIEVLERKIIHYHKILKTTNRKGTIIHWLEGRKNAFEEILEMIKKH